MSMVTSALSLLYLHVELYDARISSGMKIEAHPVKMPLKHGSMRGDLCQFF